MSFMTPEKKSQDLQFWLTKYCNTQILCFKMDMLTFLHLCRVKVIFKLPFLIFFTSFFSLMPQLCSQFNQIIPVLSFVVVWLLIFYQDGQSYFFFLYNDRSFLGV